MNILNLLKEIKYSYYLNEKVYTEGGCFRLCCILAAISKKAKPYYSEIDGHWITKIKDSYYDINGRIKKSYVKEKQYKHITDKSILNSAYIPTYQGQTTSYNKYK